MRNPGQPIGRCYTCRRPVRRTEGSWVLDTAVTRAEGRRIRRLAHQGACATDLAARITQAQPREHPQG
jgi:hypothetical protein